MTPGADILGVVEEYDPLRERGQIRDDWGRLIPFRKSEVMLRHRLFPGDRVGFSRARHDTSGHCIAVGIVPVRLVRRPSKRWRVRDEGLPGSLPSGPPSSPPAA